MTINPQRIVNAIYGLAYGDAIGDPVEFKSYAAILDANDGALAPIPAKLRITDDTQMSLYMWDALNESWSNMTELRLRTIRQYLAWLNDADNNRAPGNTCLTALGRLEHRTYPGRAWETATVADSCGCGSVMRAPWIGLHGDVTDDQVASIARMQAALTHGHPEGTAAAAAAAVLTRELATGRVKLADAAEWLREWAVHEDAADYDREALGNLALVRDQADEAYVQQGAAAMLNAAEKGVRLAARLRRDGATFDPCSIAGQGWTAASCLALAAGIAAGCADMEPLEALRVAATTNGDSDSIGAVTGALLGAGGALFPIQLASRIESRYQDELFQAAVQYVHA